MNNRGVRTIFRLGAGGKKVAPHMGGARGMPPYAMEYPCFGSKNKYIYIYIYNDISHVHA
jgi:hypothetical protein